MTPTQLQIKTKALQRLLKEELYYKEELRQQQETVAKLKSDPSVDSYDLKKQVQVLNDTERLLPVLYEKIEEFCQDLKNFIEIYEGNESLVDSNELVTEAETLLKSIEK